MLYAHSLRRDGVDLHDVMTIEQFYPLAVEHRRVAAELIAAQEEPVIDHDPRAGLGTEFVAPVRDKWPSPSRRITSGPSFNAAAKLKLLPCSLAFKASAVPRARRRARRQDPRHILAL